MGRMIEEKIGEEIKSFIYLNYKIIGYHYKGEIYFNHYSAENTIKAETNSKGEAKYFEYGFDGNYGLVSNNCRTFSFDMMKFFKDNKTILEKKYIYQ